MNERAPNGLPWLPRDEVPDTQWVWMLPPQNPAGLAGLRIRDEADRQAARRLAGFGYKYAPVVDAAALGEQLAEAQETIRAVAAALLEPVDLPAGMMPLRERLVGRVAELVRERTDARSLAHELAMDLDRASPPDARDHRRALEAVCATAGIDVDAAYHLRHPDDGPTVLSPEELAYGKEIAARLAGAVEAQPDPQPSRGNWSALIDTPAGEVLVEWGEDGRITAGRAGGPFVALSRGDEAADPRDPAALLDAMAADEQDRSDAEFLGLDAGTIARARTAATCRQAIARLRAEAVALRQRAEAAEREVQRMETIVCASPACTAAIVRRDDGSRVCAAGHPARWVNVDLLKTTEAERDYLRGVADSRLYAIKKLISHRKAARAEAAALRERAEALLAAMRLAAFNLGGGFTISWDTLEARRASGAGFGGDFVAMCLEMRAVPSRVATLCRALTQEPDDA